VWRDKLPETYEMYVRDGGNPALFEDIIAVWVAAGGDPEWSAKSYLLGTNRLRATRERYNTLHDKAKSDIEDLWHVGARLLPLP